jgi:integrase
MSTLTRKPLPQFAFLSPDWQHCIDSFLTHAYEKSGSISTYVHYCHYVSEYLNRYGVAPEKVSREQVEEYLASPGQHAGRLGSPVRMGTRNARLAAISAMYRYAQEWPVNDSDGIPQPLLKRLSPVAGVRYVQREKPGLRSFTESETALFFGALDVSTVEGARNKAMFLFLLTSCARLSVLISLKWSDIQEAVFQDGAGQRSGWTFSWFGKGHHRQRETAELLPIVHQAIQHYLEVSGKITSIQANDPVFTNYPGKGQHGYNTHKHLAPQSIWSINNRCCLNAGLSPRPVHAWRHSGAAARYTSGQDILAISHLLRHADLAQCKTYLVELCSVADSPPAALAARFASL